MSNITRREFGIMAGAAMALAQLPAYAQSGAKGKLTAGEVVERIKKNLGIPWNDKTFRDTYHVGGADMPVNGIATSFGGNFRVMDLADKAGLNMLIVHEPTFYSDADVIDWVKDDPMYLKKLDWATKHNIVLWRIHDHAHRHNPDFIRMGWNDALGWNQYLDKENPNIWKLPRTTLGEVAKHVAKVLNSRSVRVVGDPNLPVATVGRGGHLLAQCTNAIWSADAMIVSETTEYDTFEYVRDTVLTGAKKGAIFISHSSGEDEGMRYFAEWLKPLVPELPVKFIPTTDEYWSV
jgi:putative NIF3 family GTP cyclohydrolase 1 type 2